MPKKPQDQRKKEKAKKQLERAKRRESTRRKVDLFSLCTLDDESLLNLVPRAKVESIVQQSVTWRIIRTQVEMLAWSVAKYNHCVVTDVDYRNLGVPADRHPLHKYYAAHIDRPTLAGKVHYRHNQVVVEGSCGKDICVTLHLAAAFPDSLHLGFIELANPGVVAERPMDDEQQYEGLRHGVLAEILTNLRQFALSNGFQRVSSYAVDPMRAGILCRRGFRPDTEHHLYEMSLRSSQQIPIVMDLTVGEIAMDDEHPSDPTVSGPNAGKA